MYKQPPQIKNESGELRKIGYELEFSNLSSDEVSHLIMDLYGGYLERKNRYYMEVKNTRHGDFTVKIDTSFLYNKKYRDALNKLGVDFDQVFKREKVIAKVEKALEDAFSIVIPYEIVTPPMKITKPDLFDPLVETLRNSKAKGTGASALFAFAAHINPEVPSASVESLIHYLKSFMIIYPWLYDRMNIDLSRRMTSFFDPFPLTYVDLVVSNHYHPDLETFIKHYNQYNPDRNRPLDLYPVLAFLDKSVAELEGIGNVKSRPTFHFRLPNSEIDQPHWSFAQPWNNWCFVEIMASDEKTVSEFCEEYHRKKSNTIIGFERQWKNMIDKYFNSLPA